MTDEAFTILVVEDDAVTRTFLADNLTADGYELLVAECARDARRLLERQFPDLAVGDVGLPDGSGLDLIRTVRESDGAMSRIDPTLPILVLSGRGDEVDRLRGHDAMQLADARGSHPRRSRTSRWPTEIRVSARCSAWPGP